jgi:hypothetical protein
MFLREPADNRCAGVCHVGGGILDLSFVMGNCSGDSTAPTRACRWSFTTRSGASTRRRRPRPNYKRSPSFGFSTCKWNWPSWPQASKWVARTPDLGVRGSSSGKAAPIYRGATPASLPRLLRRRPRPAAHIADGAMNAPPALQNLAT